MGTSSNSSLLPLSRISRFGIGACGGHAKTHRLGDIDIEAAREATDGRGDAELARAWLVHALEIGDRGEGIAVFGREATRREVDATQLEGIEAAERDGAVRVEAEGGDDRRSVEQHPRLRDVAAAHEEPRPLPNALKSRERLDRAEEVGRSARGAHDFEVGEGHIRQVAQTEGAGFDRDRLQGDRGELHHDGKRAIEREIDGTPDFQVAGLLNDKRHGAGLAGIESEPAHMVRERPFQRLEQKRVGSGKRLPGKVSHGAGHGRRLLGSQGDRRETHRRDTQRDRCDGHGADGRPPPAIRAPDIAAPGIPANVVKRKHAPTLPHSVVRRTAQRAATAPSCRRTSETPFARCQ